jgi:hypothetical protein
MPPAGQRVAALGASPPGQPGGGADRLAGELLFTGEVSASFYCSFLTGTEQWSG